MAICRHTESLEAALGTLSGFTDMSAENFVTISAILPVVVLNIVDDDTQLTEGIKTRILDYLEGSIVT